MPLRTMFHMKQDAIGSYGNSMFPSLCPVSVSGSDFAKFFIPSNYNQWDDPEFGYSHTQFSHQTALFSTS